MFHFKGHRHFVVLCISIWILWGVYLVYVSCIPTNNYTDSHWINEKIQEDNACKYTRYKLATSTSLVWIRYRLIWYLMVLELSCLRERVALISKYAVSVVIRSTRTIVITGKYNCSKPMLLIFFVLITVRNYFECNKKRGSHLFQGMPFVFLLFCNGFV